MKLSVCLLLTLLSSFAFAGTNINLTCAVPTTIFSASTEGEKVILKINHPYGLQYTPLYKGAIAPISLDHLIHQREIAKKLGSQQTFVWPLESCKVREGRILECTKGEKFEINGLQIRPVTFRTMVNQLSMAMGDYEVFTVDVVFVVENAPAEAGLMFSLTSDYSFKQHCHQSN